MRGGGRASPSSPHRAWGDRLCRTRDSPSGARPSAGACTRPRWNCWPTPASTCATSRRSRCSAPPAPRSTAVACASRRGSSRTRSRARRASGCSSRAAATPQPLVLRDGEVYYGTGSDVLYVRDPESGERRRVRRADVEGMAALCEMLPNIDFVMSMGLPEDAPQGIDDLVQVVAMLRGTRKPLLVAPRDGSVLARMQEMAAACGEKESFGIYAMPSPPLMHDPDALTKVIGCAELLIPLIYAPAPNMGATGPRSITGAVLVGNAETLSGLVLHQHVNERRAVRLRRRRRRHGHAHHDRSVRLAGRAAGAAGRHRHGSPLRAAELLLRRHVRLQGCSTSSGAPRPRSAWPTARSRARRCCTTSATSSRACRAATSPSSSATSSWATRASSCARCRWTTTAWRSTRSRPPGPGGNHLGTKYTRRHHREFWTPALLDHNVHDRWAAEGATTLGARVRDPPRRAARRRPALRAHRGAGRPARGAAGRGAGRPGARRRVSQGLSQARIEGPVRAQDRLGPGGTMKTRFSRHVWRHPGNSAVLLILTLLLLALVAVPVAAAVGQPVTRGRRRAPPSASAGCSSPTTSTRSSGSSARTTRSGTSTTTSSSASTPRTSRPSPSWPRAGRSPTTARPGRSRSARASSGRTASR